MSNETRQESVSVSGGHVEITRCGELSRERATLICTSHPIDAFGSKTSALLATASGAAVVSVNPRGVGNSSSVDDESDHLYGMIDDLEAVRRHLGAARWVQFPAWREAFATNGLLDSVPSSPCTRDELEWLSGPGSGATLRRKAGPALPIRHARALHEALPDSELLVVEGAGHAKGPAKGARARGDCDLR